jgi:hypothetical protein
VSVFLLLALTSVSSFAPFSCLPFPQLVLPGAVLLTPAQVDAVQAGVARALSLPITDVAVDFVTLVNLTTPSSAGGRRL